MSPPNDAHKMSFSLYRRQGAMFRSSNVNFHNLSSFQINFDDSDESSHSSDTTPMMKELAAMFSEYSIHVCPENDTTIPFRIRSEEFEIVNVDSPLDQDLPCHVEPIDGVIIHVAHLEQFPKPESPYSASLPCVFAWIDANATFSSEYSSSIHLYYKTCYTAYRSTLHFYFALAPSHERLQTMEQLRRDIPTGRICYHYVGHGFPPIQEQGIWCSERRSSNFELFSLHQLFQQFPPPTWFIFDCSNAGVVLRVFEEAEALNAKVNSVAADWSDWLCICACREGEKLPNDPRLPKDFLTSVILQPIRTAVVCHILQHFRLTLVGDKFPLELPLSHLSDSKSPEMEMLMQALTAVTEGIAADSLSPGLYQKMFRREKLTSTIFRHFLLAQYLLRPYRVHPVSHPTIPDLSRHPLWRQWSIVLDTAICQVAASPPSYATDMFVRSATSFEMFLRNKQLSLIRPYHFTLLYHMLAADPDREEPLMLLAEYAAQPDCSAMTLVNSAVFNTLFAKLMHFERTNPCFHPVCYLIAKLLYLRPQFASDIGKDIEVAHFPQHIFASDIDVQTRVLCAAIVSNLAVCHEKFQEVCTSPEFLDRARQELQVCSAEMALWILMVIRRGFHLYSPDPISYTENGIHLQSALFVTSVSPLIRAAAVSVITSFVRQFECAVNAHHMFLGLIACYDASYLVRFQVLLLVKKFLMSFDGGVPEVSSPSEDFDHSTFLKLMNSVYSTKEKPFSHFRVSEEFLKELDSLFARENFSSIAPKVALFILTMFAKDPHPTISSIATNFLEFVSKQKSYNDDCACLSARSIGDWADDAENQFDREHLSFANLDQNQSLHFIALHDLLEKRIWRAPGIPIPNVSLLSDSKVEMSPSKSALPKSEPPAQAPNVTFVEMLKNHEIATGEVRLIDVDTECSSVAAFVEPATVVYITANDRHERQDKEVRCDVNALKIVARDRVVFTTSDGCCCIWCPYSANPMATFRIDPQWDVNGKSMIAYSEANPTILLTATSKGLVHKWDMNSEKLIGEWDLGGVITCLTVDSCRPETIVAGMADGTVAVIDTSCHMSEIVRDRIFDSPVWRLGCTNDGTYFAVTNTGECIHWNGELSGKQPLLTQHLMPLADFAVHRTQPHLVFCGIDHVPIITDVNGTIIKVIDEIPAVSICRAHPTRPLYTFGTKIGTCTCFKFCNKD